MPRVEVIDVSECLIENTDDLRVDVAGASIPFGDVVNIQDFARVLVLDKWTCNSDRRQAIFKHETSRSPRHTAVFIDQKFCFNAGEWNFPDAPLRGACAAARVKT